jgi:UDP-glucose 4-epimerase
MRLPDLRDARRPAMNIAVTGGSGFVGSSFLPAAVADGHRVTVLGRGEGSRSLCAAGERFAYAATDYSVESLVRILPGHDAVVHLGAAKFSRDWGVETYLQAVGVAAALLEACRRVGLTNVVLMSSRTVYSAHNALPWSEEARVVPQNLYGAAKAAVEILGEFSSAHQGLRCKSLRLAQVLGHGERGGYLLNTFIRQAAAGETLLVYGSGSGRREFIYVKDVAAAILAALDKGQVSGIFNIGTGAAVSALELAELVNDVFDNAGNLARRPELPEDAGTHLLDVAKARRQLDWSAHWTLAAALRDMRATLREQPAVTPCPTRLESRP